MSLHPGFRCGAGDRESLKGNTLGAAELLLRTGGCGLTRWLPVFILCGFVLLAVGYSLGTPPWEAPDEPSHYLYAEHIAAHGTLPPEAPPQRAHYWEDGYVTSLYEWYQPPLYYALVAPQIVLVDWVTPGTIPQSFPPVEPAFPMQARNLFVMQPESANASPGLRLARFFSIVLGLCTLLVVHRMAILLSAGDRAFALVTTGTMAFIPQYTFLSGYVTNDNLALLLAALCLLLFLQLLHRSEGRQTGLTAGAGVVLALALYTKLSLLFLLPLGLLCLLFRFAHHRSTRRWMLESTMLIGVAVLPFLLGLLVAPGLRDQLTYAWTALRVKPGFISLEYLAGLWPQTYTSFWGTFGWMNVSTPRWIANSLTVIFAVGLIGSAAQLAHSSRRDQTEPLRGWLLLLLWVACGFVATGFIRFNLSIRQPQGRLLFAALPALVILVAFGYQRLSGKLFPALGTALVLFTLAANLICLFGTLLPAYALPL